MKAFFRITMLVVLVGSTQLTFGQETKIRFFGQPEITNTKITEKSQYVGVNEFGQYETRDTTYNRTNFNNGDYVLFVTSQLSERISVLSEVSFNNAKGESTFEVQRLLARYYIKDYFSLRVGKMFTPIGYWNNQFTLGLVLQPTIQRPMAIRPVDAGGVLQYRDAGIQFEGDNISSARLFYRVLLGNGVGYFGSNDKRDNHIATTVQIGAEPVDGLKIIASGMFDRIEQGKSNPNGSIKSLPDDGNLQLFVASAAYMNPTSKFEFIGEYLGQKSKFDNAGTFNSYSYYGYAGYRVTEKITPYFLYNSTQAGESETVGDPYFSPIPINIELLTIGARYKFNSSFVCKLEYEMSTQKNFYQDIVVGGTTLDGAFNSTLKSNSVRLQLAFLF